MGWLRVGGGIYLAGNYVLGFTSIVPRLRPLCKFQRWRPHGCLASTVPGNYVLGLRQYSATVSSLMCTHAVGTPRVPHWLWCVLSTRPGYTPVCVRCVNFRGGDLTGRGTCTVLGLATLPPPLLAVFAPGFFTIFARGARSPPPPRMHRRTARKATSAAGQLAEAGAREGQ